MLHTHACANGEIAGVLVHPWSSLADTRVCDELDLGTGSSVLENREVGAIAFYKRPLVLCSSVWKGRYNSAAKGKAGVEKRLGPHIGARTNLLMRARNRTKSKGETVLDIHCPAPRWGAMCRTDIAQSQ